MQPVDDSPSPMPRPWVVAAAIAAAYGLIGLLWIAFSDQLASALAPTLAAHAAIQTYKGIGYVLVTAVALYALVHHFLAALDRSNRALRTHRDHLLDLSRAQRLLRAVNAALLRVNDEQLLLQATCRAIVREGGFLHAWIALADGTGTAIERVADAQGAPQETLELDDGQVPGSIVAQALHDGHPHGLRGHGDPWIDRLAPAGLGHEAALALPLRTAEGVSGVVVLYGRRGDTLDDEEQRRLLGEVADNLGIALGYLRHRRTVHHLAYHDDLTGIGNRQLIEHRLEAALNTAEQHRAAVGVIVLDVDRFRETNDTGGRAAGDRVLQATAQLLSGVVRPGDTVGRLGNDEFAVILADVPSVDVIGRLAERVAQCFPERLDVAGLDLYLSASMGVAVYPTDALSAGELLGCAEVALHAQADKRSGTLTYYAPELERRARERRELETALRWALPAGELELAWQPVVDVTTTTTVGAEALLRWYSPRLGTVPPDRFVPIAEEAGLIGRIGDWVLEQACERGAQWQRAGHDLDIAVNVSLQQLQAPDFVARVREVLAPYTGRRWRLVLEITESEFMADPEPVAAACRELKALGCAIHVDDFGTGYSALNYLTRLPLDGLKIDRSFVSRIESDRGVASITQAVLALAAGLGLEVIAEGVETPGQLERVRALGCNRVQGFLHGAPAPAETFRREHLPPAAHTAS